MTKGALTGLLASSHLSVGGGAGVATWQVIEAANKAYEYERELCISAADSYTKTVSRGNNTLDAETRLREPAIKYCKIVSINPETNIYTFAPRKG